MQYEVKIYGDISEEKGENFFTLQDLQDQLKNYSDEEEILVRIKTNGGSMFEGFAIYNELRRFSKEKNVKIVTRTDGVVASIGTIIFLAGEERIMNHYLSPFIHEASGEIDEKTLQTFNNKIANFYAEHTTMTKEMALNLMKQETFIEPEDALKYKFGTSMENIEKPVILMRIINNTKKKNNNMDKNEKSPEFLKGFFDKVTALLKGNKVQNKIIFDANNDEIEFAELSEDDVVQVGAQATYKGAPANGEIVAADGNTYVFEDGTLKEIRKKTDEEDAEKRALEEKIAELENKLKTEEEKSSSLIAKLDVAIKDLNEKNSVLDKLKNIESTISIEDKKERKKEVVKETITAMMDLNSIKL